MNGALRVGRDIAVALAITSASLAALPRDLLAPRRTSRTILTADEAAWNDGTD
jgi:hypothetical protein